MLPEIEEDAASSEIANLYADIRTTLNVPKVNLIYRYFAATEGVLNSVWPILRPQFRSGCFARLARDNDALYAIQSTHMQLLKCCLADAAARESIIEILDFYLKANPLNLYALVYLNEISISPEDEAQKETPLMSIKTLRASVDIHNFDMPADELMFLVSQGAAAIRPTLLRQLQSWPDYLNNIFAFVKACCLDERFNEEVSAVYDKAKLQIAELPAVQSSRRSILLDPEVKVFCRYFPFILIRMTLLANALRKAL